MSITPNRQGLKDLANFNIDAQFCQQYGANVFNYSGEVTPEYEKMVKNLIEVINDLIKHLKAIHEQLPINK